MIKAADVLQKIGYPIGAIFPTVMSWAFDVGTHGNYSGQFKENLSRIAGPLGEHLALSRHWNLQVMATQARPLEHSSQWWQLSGQELLTWAAFVIIPVTLVFLVLPRSLPQLRPRSCPRCGRISPTRARAWSGFGTAPCKKCGTYY
jgi:hypothetical protein